MITQGGPCECVSLWILSLYIAGICFGEEEEEEAEVRERRIALRESVRARRFIRRVGDFLDEYIFRRR